LLQGRVVRRQAAAQGLQLILGQKPQQSKKMGRGIAHFGPKPAAATGTRTSSSASSAARPTGALVDPFPDGAA
jgi:hypothetical protein